jgi:hypothetical protein
MTENKKKVNDYIINRKEISNLLFNMGEGISTHSLSMWLKSKTDDEFVVVPRVFCVLAIQFFEGKISEYSEHLPWGEETLKKLSLIKNYL